MQKKIIALAIAAAFAAPVAAVQAEVMMYGSMDGGLRQQKNSNDAVGTTATFAMGQWNTARFGFKGTDDLGDGMKAVVVLETSLNPGNVGTNPVMNTSTRTTVGNPTGSGSTTENYSSNNSFGLLFDRQATVGLEGGFGKFDMGWQAQLAATTVTSFDPLQGKLLLVSAAQKMTINGETRAGNMIYSKQMGDVKVSYEHQVANADRANKAGQGFANALAVNYASGPINAAASYTVKQSSPYQAAGYDDSATHLTIGAGYKMDDIKLSVGYVSKTAKTATSTATESNANATDRTMFAGVNYAMSNKVGLTAAYYSQTTNAGAAATAPDDATSKRAVIAATYALSKATTAYAEIDRTAAVAVTAGVAGAEGITNGMGFGLNTSF